MTQKVGLWQVLPNMASGLYGKHRTGSDQSWDMVSSWFVILTVLSADWSLRQSLTELIWGGQILWDGLEKKKASEWKNNDKMERKVESHRILMVCGSQLKTFQEPSGIYSYPDIPLSL